MKGMARRAGLYAIVDGAELLISRDPEGRWVLATSDPAARERGFVEAAGTGVFTRILDVTQPVEVIGVSYAGLFRGEQVRAHPNTRGEFQVWTTDAAAGRRLGFPDIDRGTWLGIVPADDPDLCIREVRESATPPWLPRAGTGDVRDRRAGRTYFDQAVESNRRAAVRHEQTLALPPEKLRTPDLAAVAAGAAAWSRAREFSARYSRGDDRAALTAVFATWLDDAETAAVEKARPEAKRLRDAQDVPGGILSFYVSRLWLVSVACTLAVGDDEFRRVERAVGPLRGDRLVSSLLATRDPAVPVGTTDWHPRRFGDLADAFCARDRSAAVARHLDGWYPRMKGVDWWDGHTYLRKVHYVGYWAFEAAGVAVALDLDAAPFRANEYYPGDL